MTLLSVVKDVCAVVGVPVPTSIITNIAANRTMQEMLALANEMAQRISYDAGRDWMLYRKTATYVGDGVWVPPLTPPPPVGVVPVFTGTIAFDLPANYKRMLLTGNVWRSTTATAPMRFISDTDEWMNRRALNWVDPFGEWTMMGGQIHIFPIMAAPVPADPGPPPVAAVAGVTAYHAYMEKNCVKIAAGGVGDSFTADGDSFRLDERLLKLGMVWQWKANKGTSYAEDMGTFSDAMAMAMGHDKPSPIIIGREPMSATTRTAYPWPVPT